MKHTLTSICLLLMALTIASPAAAQTTVTWWQFWTDPAIKPTIESIVEEFEAQHPDIDIKMTDLTWANGHEKIVVAFASNTAPDILELGSDWIAQFAANGRLADISDRIVDDSAEFQGWSMATYEGKVYAQPWILGTRVLYINRDLLERAGYARDWVPATIPDMGRAATKIDSLGEDIYGWGSNTAEKHRLYKKFLPFFWSNDAKFFTDDGEYCLLSSAKSVSSLMIYQSMHKIGYVATQRGIEDAFLDGKIGFILSGDWLLKRIELENRKIAFSTALFPGTIYPGRSFLGGEFLAINADSEHKDAAMQFIEFLTSPANQVRFCKANRSANPSAFEAQRDDYFQSNPHLSTFVKQIAMANHPPVDPDWVYLEDIIEQAVERVIFDEELPGQVLLEAQHEVTRLKQKE